MVLYMARPSVCGGEDYGTVFELRPPATCLQVGTVLLERNRTLQLYGIPGWGKARYTVNLAFDQAGDIYGTTY